MPDDVSEGNDVAVYNVQLLYAGWIEVVSTTTEENKKKIWAVGNQKGLEAYFNPYITQNGSTGEKALTSSNSGIPESSLADQIDTTNYNTQNGKNEKKVLDGTWKSGTSSVVSNASVLKQKVKKSDNKGQVKQNNTK